MRILYLCPDLGIPVLGRKGASVHVRELIAAFARAGHRVTLAAQSLVKFPTDKPARVRARVVHIPSDPAMRAAVRAIRDFNECLGRETQLPRDLRRITYNDHCYRELKRRFQKHKPDFIYERASLYATAGAQLAAQLKVARIVELNAPLVVEQTAYRSTELGELAARAEQWTLTRADAVIVVSTRLARHARKLGVSAKRIHVMPNGVDPELFCASAAGSLTPSKSKDASGTKRTKQPVLGFVGGLRPWHGVEVLPELLARLQRRYPALRLIIAGDGQLRSRLESEFRKRRLTRRVTFTGALSHEAVPDVIRQFDIALAPYPRHDHDFYFSPLKLFEYMACGVAVAASRAGQISEVVRHGDTGLLYPPGNVDALVACCEKLLAEPKLRARLGQAAARAVRRKFTWDINAAKTVELAQRLFRARRPQP